MFGIGTGELVLITVLAIVILGPQRCIESFRKAGRFWRSIQAEIAATKSDIDVSGDDPSK